MKITTVRGHTRTNKKGKVSAVRSHTRGYTADEVRRAGFTLEPMRCKYCGSQEVTFHQYVPHKSGGGSAYCSNCGRWQ